MYTETQYHEMKTSVLEQVRAQNYPEGHPFLDLSFEHDMLLTTMVCLRTLIKEDVLQHFLPKMSGRHEGVFHESTYFEGLNEYTVFYYLVTSLFHSELVKSEPAVYSLLLLGAPDTCTEK